MGHDYCLLAETLHFCNFATFQLASRMTVHDHPNLLYPALENNGEVRLLALIPENNGPIRTTRSKASPKDANESIPRYTAISYIWSPPAPKRSIACNGVDITVTANLEAVLVQPRHSSQERVIWVDQLYINQNDYTERHQQVSMMGRIYSMAEQVAVWLGPSDKDTPMLWNLFLDLTSLRDFAKTEVYDLALRNKSSSPS